MSPKRIDIHTHLYPQWYLEALAQRSEPPRVAGWGSDSVLFSIFASGQGPPLTEAFYSVEKKLAFMEANEIAVSVVSLGNPWLQWVTDDKLATDYADRANEWFAALPSETSGAMVGMGCLPEASIGGAVQYAARLAATHNIVGVVIGTTLCGLELDDPRLEGVFEALAEARLPLFLHPHHSLGAERLEGYGPALNVALGFPSETTLALGRMLLGGVLRRHPQLRVVVAHAGGTMPMLSGRFVAAASPYVKLGEGESTLLEDLRRVAADSIAYSTDALRLSLATFGDSAIMFGTDHPFYVSQHPAIRTAVDDLSSQGLEDAINVGNAINLFALDTSSRQVGEVAGGVT